MKRKIMSITAMGLIGVMNIASFTGCGMNANATDESYEAGATIIVDDNENTEDEINIKVDTTEDINISDEVISNTEENSNSSTKDEANEVTYTEHEYFYIASQLDMSTKEDAINPDDLEFVEKTFELGESIPLYELRDFIAVAGYTKPNITVQSFWSDDEWVMLVFEGEEKYQYMLVKTEDVYGTAEHIDEQQFVAPDDIINAFYERYSEEYSEGNWSIVDITSDMEYVDIEISKTISTPETYVMSMGDKYGYNSYTKFNIEFLGQEDDYMTFRIYYKDQYVYEE